MHVAEQDEEERGPPGGSPIQAGIMLRTQATGPDICAPKGLRTRVHKIRFDDTIHRKPARAIGVRNFALASAPITASAIQEIASWQSSFQRNQGTLIIEAAERVDSTNAQRFLEDLDAAIEPTDQVVILDMEKAHLHKQCGPPCGSADGQDPSATKLRLRAVRAFRDRARSLRNQRFRPGNSYPSVAR